MGILTVPSPDVAQSPPRMRKLGDSDFEIEQCHGQLAVPTNDVDTLQLYASAAFRIALANVYRHDRGIGDYQYSSESAAEVTVVSQFCEWFAGRARKLRESGSEVSLPAVEAIARTIIRALENRRMALQRKA